MSRPRRTRWRFVVASAATVLLVVLVPLSVNWIAQQGLDRADKYASIVAAFVAVVAVALLVVKVFQDYRSDAISSSGDRKRIAAMQLIETMSMIEKYGTPLARRNSPSRMGQVKVLPLRVVAENMRALGVWGEEDFSAFDVALRARNSIVHGDLQEVDMLDLRYAVAKASQLLAKVQSAGDALADEGGVGSEVDLSGDVKSLTLHFHKQKYSAEDLKQFILSFENMLASRRRVLGEDHPDTLTSLNNLAGAYRSAGRMDDAIRLFEQALASRRRVLGEDHPDTLASLNNLADVYQAAGQVDAAATLRQSNGSGAADGK